MKHTWEIKLFGLSFLTLFLWFFKFNVLIPFFIFVVFFIYFMYKKLPIYYYLIVIVFSIMSCQNRISFLVVDYPLIILLFGMVLYRCMKEKKWVMGKLFIPFVLYIGYNLISFLWTPSFYDGIDGIMGVLEGVFIYFIMTNQAFHIDKSDFIKIAKLASIIMFTLTVEVVLTYLQNGITHVIDNKNLLNLEWAISNLFAVIYVFLLPIAFYKYLNHKKIYLFYLLLDSVNLVGLLLSLSRGAYLGFIVSMVLFSFLVFRKKLLIRYGGVMAGVIVVLIVFKNQLLQLITKHIAYQNLLYDSNRDVIYQLGWKSFTHHLILGEGVGSSKYLIYHELQTPYAHYHSFGLQIAATLGIIGLLLFMYIVYNWFRILDWFHEPFVLCVVFSIIGVLTHQLFDVSFDLYFFGVFFYLLIGVVEVYRSQNKRDPFKMKIIHS